MDRWTGGQVDKQIDNRASGQVDTAQVDTQIDRSYGIQATRPRQSYP